MVMRKPTGPDGAAPDTPVGPEPAAPYDPSEWDRRLAEARERAAALLGAEEAERLVHHRPQAILDDLPSSAVPEPPKAQAPGGWRGFM